VYDEDERVAQLVERRRLAGEHALEHRHHDEEHGERGERRHAEHDRAPDRERDQDADDRDRHQQRRAGDQPDVGGRELEPVQDRLVHRKQQHRDEQRGDDGDEDPPPNAAFPGELGIE